MKSTLPPQIGPRHNDMLQSRVRAVTQMRTHGTLRLPAAPRGVIAQPGEAGVLLTWHLPTRYKDVTGYRIYQGTEKNLAVDIRDRGTRQFFMPVQAGATPPPNNFFISVVNGFREGPKLQIQAAATANAQIPNPKPQPTTDFLNIFSGGLDKTQSGHPTGKKTP